jgi:hypothetical protein
VNVSRARLIGALGGASLLAAAALLTPAFATTSDSRAKAPRPSAATVRPVGTFTPAVADPRLAAFLAARRGTGAAAPSAEFRFTPAGSASGTDRAVRVAIRARANTPAEAARTVAEAGTASQVTAITPSSYNLGVSVGWRRFAVSGDVSQSEGGILPGTRESAQLGMSYRANPRLTGRVEVAAERAEGAQRIVADDQAVSLGVAGSYSIARNLDVTAGARYRISRDRLEPMSRDERRDSQAVYIGTAFRF